MYTHCIWRRCIMYVGMYVCIWFEWCHKIHIPCMPHLRPIHVYLEQHITYTHCMWRRALCMCVCRYVCVYVIRVMPPDTYVQHMFIYNSTQCILTICDDGVCMYVCMHGSMHCIVCTYACMGLYIWCVCVSCAWKIQNQTIIELKKIKTNYLHVYSIIHAHMHTHAYTCIHVCTH